MCTQEDSTEKTSSRSSISTGLLKFKKKAINVRKKSWAEFMSHLMNDMKRARALGTDALIKSMEFEPLA